MNALPAFLPHDLLWGMAPSALPEDAPDWVIEVLSLGHPVVVRRQTLAQGRVAVGVRGPAREQRFATCMSTADIHRRVSPEQLVDFVGTGALWPALQALEQVKPVMSSLDLVWGISGSAGFELASGVSALHRSSDLDLILRTPRFVERRWAAELVEALEVAVCRVDVQLQLPQGAIALREWAGTSEQVLLKTSRSAELVGNPWQPLEVCA